MAMNILAHKQTNWWVWGGAAVAAIVVITALGYGFDWYSTGTTDEVAPAVEQASQAKPLSISLQLQGSKFCLLKMRPAHIWNWLCR